MTTAAIACGTARAPTTASGSEIVNFEFNSVMNPDRVWLFHGTTADAAEGFMRDGWNPPDPNEHVRSFAHANGISPDLLLDEYTDRAASRIAAGEMSCTTGWRHAAAYARNGSEYLHFARGALERLKQAANFHGNPPPFDADVAILLFRVPWAEVSNLTVDEAAPSRAKFLPEKNVWSTLGLFEQLDRAPSEVVVHGRRLRPYLVGTDTIRPECDCNPFNMLGAGATDDTRLRCRVCMVTGSPASGQHRSS